MPKHTNAAPDRSEIRKDPIIDKYVIIAPRRSKRPDQTGAGRGERAVGAMCVFCPEQVDRVADRYHVGPRKRTWRVKVIDNKFPAVSRNNPKAYGIQEVVIETPDHRKQLHDLPVQHIGDIFRAYAQRTRDVAKNKSIEYIMIFKNSGGSAGASIQHSHSQVFATSFIPPQLLRRSQAAQQHRMQTGRCAYCDMIRFEERSPRCIFRNKDISVFAPFASQNNYEVWMLPRRHFDNVSLMRTRERLVFAQQLKRVLRKITELELPYNYYFHQVVNDEDQHFYIKIRPRGNVWAGVEIGSGVIINPVPPEKAAQYYRA